MTRDELDTISRVAIARARVVVDDVCNEFRCHEMGDARAEALVGQIQDRMHERLETLIPNPEVRHSGK